jgi:hypothetical protein
MKLGSIKTTRKRYRVGVLIVCLFGAVMMLLVQNDPARRLRLDHGRAVNLGSEPLWFDWGEGVPVWPKRVTSARVQGAFADEALEHLVKLETIRTLNLNGVSITGSLIERLGAMEELQTLQISSGRVTQEGLEAVSELSDSVNVRVYSLFIDDWTEITPRGWALLAEQPVISALRLKGDSINDEAMIAVSRLNKLSLLDMYSAPVTEKGFESLIRMENLMTLGLMEMRVTDETIRTVERIPNLRILTLMDTQAPEASLARLQKNRPQLKIRRLEYPTP